MAAGITTGAAAFVWLAFVGGSYLTAILPGTLLWGLGLGLTVTPLTAAVLAAVVLGERLEPAGMVGAALLTVAVLLAARADRR